MSALDYQVSIHSKDCASRLTGEQCDCIQPKAAAELAQLRAENAELRKVMKFYADMDNWNHYLEEPSCMDSGDKARAVLAKGEQK